MMQAFEIRFPSESRSKIEVVDHALQKLAAYLAKTHAGAQVAVITDGNVAALYHDQIKSALPEADLMAVEAGEKSKTLKVTEALCEDLLEAGFTRKDVVVGLGGGMITDLAGFVASIYMRGVPYIAVPTSLLAMVDAAVGGKTGVNLGAKNTVGTFYPAEAILVDQTFLKTLPERELQTGLAEVIKYAATLDASLEGDLMAKKMDFCVLLKKSIAAKVRVCDEDLREDGLRKVLNFGHTFGHAIEYLSHYKLTHGEAISIGMVLANRIAQKLGKQTKAYGDQISEMLERHGLPTELPKDMKLAEVIGMVHKDKKMEGKKVTFILSPKMGKYEMTKLSPEELKKLLR